MIEAQQEQQQEKQGNESGFLLVKVTQISGGDTDLRRCCRSDRKEGNGSGIRLVDEHSSRPFDKIISHFKSNVTLTQSQRSSRFITKMAIRITVTFHPTELQAISVQILSQPNKIIRDN